MALAVKNLPANAGDIKHMGLIPGSERSPGEGNATHSIILGWRIPWTEEPGGLQSMRSQNWTLLKQLNTQVLGLFYTSVAEFSRLFHRYV